MMSLLLALITSVNVFAADINQLNSVAYEEVGDTPSLTFEFEKKLNVENLEARFIKRTIEWDLPDTKLKKDKLFINVSKYDINNVYASHNDKSTVRIRVNLDNGKMASNYHERIQYFVEDNKLRFKLDASLPLVTSNIKEISRVYDVVMMTEKSDDHKEVEDHLAKVNTIKVEEEQETIPVIADSAPETEIPLKVKKVKEAAADDMSVSRMASGLLVVALLFVSGVLVTRKLKNKKSSAPFNHDSITVISQKYLGPKRNLVLIRVTGEYLLLGVTDHNISLIKNLNVVDDEIPELTGEKNFDNVLSKKEQDSESFVNDEEDSFSVSSLDDVKKIFKKKRYIDEMDL